MAENGSKESLAEFTNAVPYENLRICVIGEQLRNDNIFLTSLKALNLPFLFCNSVVELIDYVDSEDCETVFVVENFEGEEFSLLKENKKRIYGPTFIKQCAADDQTLPNNYRPRYCAHMQKLVVWFTGFSVKEKDKMQQLVKLIHNMGGGVRKEFSPTITHLIANCTISHKYKYSVGLGIPIMSPGWIFALWDRRNDINCSATDQDLIQEHKLKPFFNCRLAFMGFNDDERQEMEKITEQHGGIITEKDFDSATHVVVDEQAEADLSKISNPFIVRAEWFWATIQMDACADESYYAYKPLTGSPPAKITPVQTPVSKLRRKKRLRETIGQLAQLPDANLSTDQYKSTDLGVSMSDSFLDATLSPEKTPPQQTPDVGEASCFSPPFMKSPLDLKNLSGRQQVCLELLQTENNYVRILKTIISLFKEPLEIHDQIRDPLLDPTEIKIIFGNVSPIFEVHKQLRDELNNLMTNWKEDCSLGSIILKLAPDLLKAYPSFINFFEKTKETLLMCTKNKPRFHAFLKIGQTKPECGRQSLSELLIRPVQRLPSVILLLNDILKHTHKSNPDHSQLEEAIIALREVLNNINENKRKTEEQVAMFDIVNDIENCPPNLLSSHRSFVSKVDVVELSNTVSGKGENITMFLFTDYMEISKKRTKNAAMLKSPSTLSLRNQTKCYKHLELMPLSEIKRIVNISDTIECKNVFSLVCRSNQELKEKLYSFVLVSQDVDKMDFLKLLCRQVCNISCRADVENFITTLAPHELDIEKSDVNTSSLSKAVSRLASKTSRKVGRAFSMNRTPRKLKRAMSTMISPFHAPMKLNDRHLVHASASSVDLQEMDIPSNNSRCSSGSKKIKSSSFGASAAKFL